MQYETQPVTETILTIPPKYIQNESQWARQICVRHRWRLCAETGEICDSDGKILADGLNTLTAALVGLGWIVPKEEGELSAGIAWHLIPDEAEAATEELRKAATNKISQPRPDAAASREAE